MIGNYSDYVFTTGANRNLIKGSYARDAMCMTLEHWLWINEGMRTLQFQDSLRIGAGGAYWTGSTARNDPRCMAPSLPQLMAWERSANEILTRSRPYRLKAYGVWSKSVATESVRNANLPMFEEASIAAHLDFMQ